MRAEVKSASRSLAIISRDFGDGGGAEQFSYHLANPAGLPGWDLSVLGVRPEFVQAPLRFLPIREFPGAGLFQPLSFARQARRHLQQNCFSVVHSHELVYQTDLLTYGDPVWEWMTQIHPSSLLRVKTWIRFHLERRLLRHHPPRWILPMSKLVRDSLLRAYPKLSPRVQVVYPAVAKVVSPEVLGLRHQERHLRPPGPLRLLFVGSGFYRKGLDRCLEILRDLQTDGIPAELTVVGRGKSRDYLSTARRWGVEDRLYFKGFQSANIDSIYASHDVLLLLSRYETFGMVALEAMAQGLPVVVTATTGVAEFARKISPESVIHWPEQAASLRPHLRQLREASFWQHHSLQSRRIAETETWPSRQKQLLSLYDAVWEEKNRRQV